MSLINDNVNFSTLNLETFNSEKQDSKSHVW